MYGSWTNKCSNAYDWTTPEVGDGERMVGSQMDYSLENSSCWLFHHCWSLLSTIGSSCNKTSGEAGLSILITWQRQSSHRKVNAWKIYWSLDGLRFHIHLILLTWPQNIYYLFRSLSNTLGEKSSTTRRISKRILLNSSTKSLEASTKAGSFLYQSVGRKSSTVMEQALLNSNCVLDVKK